VLEEITENYPIIDWPKKEKKMVTMGGDLQPGCLADRLLTGLGQPQINP
jgi:hypothetical protein